jgi:HlyD family secretion protein
LLVARAPIDGTVLQVNIRAGEFAPAGVMSTALVVMGSIGTLHVRIDIDEADIPRFRPGAKAWASPRGAARLDIPLGFVRVDPLVVPKRALTGAGTERVDTRVLRVIYAFDPRDLPIYPGQQVDVFIAAVPPT